MNIAPRDTLTRHFNYQFQLQDISTVEAKYRNTCLLAPWALSQIFMLLILLLLTLVDLRQPNAMIQDSLVECEPPVCHLFYCMCGTSPQASLPGRDGVIKIYKIY